MTLPATAPRPRLLAGRFEIKRKLAEGGMAEVFLARQVGEGGFARLVVIKRILPSLANRPEFIRMLTNEARIGTRLNHPNLVQVYELGVSGDDQLFIAMEFVYGEDLRSLRRRLEDHDRRVPPGVACRVVAETLSGLHYAHLTRDLDGRPLGVVHRDVSPTNIIITYEGAVKLVDFGIAKSSLMVTQAGQMKGKFSYMSPEQARMQPLDGRSDVFAAGVILWELLARRPLFKREDIEGTMAAVQHAPVPPLPPLNPHVPPALDAVVQRALCRDLDGRYPSAEAMHEDLEGLIRSERWPGDALTLRNLVRELFADKLLRRCADVASAGRADMVDFLLATDEGTHVDWLGPSSFADETPSGDELARVDEPSRALRASQVRTLPIGQPALVAAVAASLAPERELAAVPEEATASAATGPTALRDRFGAEDPTRPRAAEDPTRPRVAESAAPLVSTTPKNRPAPVPRLLRAWLSPRLPRSLRPRLRRIIVTALVAGALAAIVPAAMSWGPAPTPRAAVGGHAPGGEMVVRVIDGQRAADAHVVDGTRTRDTPVVEGAHASARPVVVTQLPPSPPPKTALLLVTAPDRATLQLDDEPPVTGVQVTFAVTPAAAHHLRVRIGGNRLAYDLVPFSSGETRRFAIDARVHALRHRSHAHAGP